MTLQRILTIMAVLSFAGGLVSLLAPASLWDLFEVTLDAGGVFIARRYAGAAGLGFAMIAWLARDGNKETQHTAAYGFLTLLGVSFAVALAAQLDGLMSTAGWVIVLADLTLIGAFAHVLFRERAIFREGSPVEKGQLSKIDGGM